jgi:hypothetical protein
MAHFNRELITRLEVEPENDTALEPSPLVAKAERAKGLTARLFGAQQSEPEPPESDSSAVLELPAFERIDCAIPDPLIQGLVARLPKPDSVWSLEDRGKWLRAAAVIFSLVYKLDGVTHDRHSSEPKALP